MKKTFEFYKKRIIRAILFALIISVMAIIFVLSAQDGRDSGGTSGGLTEFLLAIFGVDAGSLDEAEFTKIEAFVRSAAHFSEYALLGALGAWCYRSYTDKKVWLLAPSVGVAVLAVLEQVGSVALEDLKIFLAIYLAGSVVAVGRARKPKPKVKILSLNFL